MERLYKGKYLIAVYKRNDEMEYCEGVYESIEQLSKYIDVRYLKCVISRSLATYHTFPTIEYGIYKFYFIDIFEEHNDVFKDEDKAFIEFYNQNKKVTIASFCASRKIKRRTFERHLALYRKGERCKYENEIKEFQKQRIEQEGKITNGQDKC